MTNNNNNNETNNTDDMLSSIFFQSEEKDDEKIEENDTKKSDEDISSNTGTGKIRSSAPHIPVQSDKPYKKKRTHFLPILAACIVLALVIGGISFALLRGQSEKKSSVLNKASVFSGLFDLSSPVDKLLDTPALMTAMHNSSISQNGKISIMNIADSDMSDIDFEYTLSKDNKNKQLAYELGASYNEAKIFSLQTLLKPDSLLFKVPSYSESVYSINYDKFGKLYKSSYNNDGDLTSNVLAQFLSSIDKNLINNLFPSVNKASYSSDIISTYIYAIEETYPEDYKTIINGITTQAADEDEYGNKGVIYNISEESTELFVQKLLTVSFDNKELYNMIIKAIEPVYKLEYENKALTDDDTAGISYDKYISDTMKSAKDTLTAVAPMIADAYSGEIACTIWKNNSGLLTGLDFSADVAIFDKPLYLSADIISYGDANPSDNMTFDISLNIDDSNLAVTYDRTTENIDTDYTLSHMIALSIDSENIFTIYADEALDTSTNDYTLDASLDIADSDAAQSTISFNLSGTFENIVKGKSFDFTMDNLSISSGYNNIVTLNGSLSLQTNAGKISKPSGSTVDVTSMSEDEITNLFDDIEYFFVKNLE